MARVFLDHASTTPLRPEARAAMVEWLDRAVVGDPSRLYSEAMEARAAVEAARAQVAVLVGARPREVVFCSGATEAIVTACHGVARSDPQRQISALAAVEHSAVRSAAERGETVELPVDGNGRVELAALDGLAAASLSVVHLQWANHEVATIQPVAAAMAWCGAHGVLGHVDAAQAVGHVPVDFAASGASLMSVSAHKFGGPLGAGALIVRRGLRLDPLLVGGDQERARRAGIENVPAIVGFGAVCATVAQTLPEEVRASRRHTGRIIDWASTRGDVTVLGETDDDGRLPHLVCLGLVGVEPQPVVLGLDAAGIAVHSGSSCSSEALEPSPVLAAMGADADRSLRISVGWSTTDADIDAVLRELPRVLDGLHALGNR